MTGRIVGVIFVGAMLCSGSTGQVTWGMDWSRALTESLGNLNTTIQQNVQQLNQRIQQTVQSNLAQAQQLTENLNADTGSSTIQSFGGNTIVAQNPNDGTKIVTSGRTSDGTAYVHQITEKVVGDTLRHVSTTYYPYTNTTNVYGYTLDLADINATPVPMNNTA